MALREIGWTIWDPIELIHHVSEDFLAGPADEYDQYLLVAFGMARDGRFESEIADYLADIACDHMGLGPSYDGEVAAKATAAAIMRLSKP